MIACVATAEEIKKFNSLLGFVYFHKPLIHCNALNNLASNIEHLRKCFW